MPSDMSHAKGEACKPLHAVNHNGTLDDGHLFEEPEGSCGYLSCRPKFLQFFNTVQAMAFFQCVFAFWEGFIVNGLINIIIFALEIRYKLTSKMTGLIASGNDFGAFVVLLFIGHYAEGRCKPKIMSVGVVSMAIGTFLFALPHFIGSDYKYVKSDTTTNSTMPSNVCMNQTEIGTESASCPAGMEEDVADAWAYPLFMVGQVFLGIGSAPMFTIGLTYLDENSKAKMTSLYTSLVMCSAAIGVAAGYITAGQTLAFYVDFNKVDNEDIHLTPQDPRWVGAWWLGIVISFGAFIILIWPFCAFPKRLPGYNYLKKTRKSEAHGDSDTDVKVGIYKGTLRDFPKAFFKLMRNPTYVLLCLASCCESLIVAGTATFGAKILQQFFNVDIMRAGFLVGVITVPGAGGGMLLGGYLVKKLKLNCSGIIKLCGIASFVSVLFSPAFLAKCDSTSLAGITTPYADSPNVTSLISPCNENCGCKADGMQPLCLDGRVTFFSPCYAGCPNIGPNDTWDIQDCTCMRQYYDENTASKLYRQNESSTNTSADSRSSMDSLKPGSCASDCVWLYVFCALFLLIMICTFSTMTPNLTAVMRCVYHDERSLAVAIQILAGRLLGTTPGPILFGALFDSSCLIWQEGCNSLGMCWVYDQTSLAYKIIIWLISIKLAAVVIYCVALKVYKPPTDTGQRNALTTNESAHFKEMTSPMIYRQDKM